MPALPLIQKKVVTRTTATQASNIAALLLCLAIISISVTVTPIDDSPVSLCVFRVLTGIPCPGCGMTRAFIYLGHGNFRNAVVHNPLSLPVALLLMAHFVRLTILVTTSVELRLILSRKGEIFLISAGMFAVLITWLSKLT
jgi:hypothetical protein